MPTNPEFPELTPEAARQALDILQAGGDFAAEVGKIQTPLLFTRWENSKSPAASAEAVLEQIEAAHGMSQLQAQLTEMFATAMEIHGDDPKAAATYMAIFTQSAVLSVWQTVTHALTFSTDPAQFESNFARMVKATTEADPSVEITVDPATGEPCLCVVCYHLLIHDVMVSARRKAYNDGLR